MSYTLDFHPIARNELYTILAWHDQERKGLGDEFEIDFLLSVAKLLENPLLHPIIQKNTQTRRVQKWDGSRITFITP